MDNGASSYHHFLNGNDDGIVEIIKEYNNCTIEEMTSVLEYLLK